METRNAIITSTSLGFADRGILDAWLHLDYGDGGCQGFGGCALYLPKGFARHDIRSVAGHHIFRILEIAGVESWDKLKGRSIRARIEDGLIKSIGHIIKDDWFCPSEDYANL